MIDGLDQLTVVDCSSHKASGIALLDADVAVVNDSSRARPVGVVAVQASQGMTIFDHK